MLLCFLGRWESQVPTTTFQNQTHTLLLFPSIIYILMQSLGSRSWSIHKKCIVTSAVGPRIGGYCPWWVLLAMRMLFCWLHLLHMDLQIFSSCLQVSELLRIKVRDLCCAQNSLMSNFEVCSTVGQTAEEAYPISRALHLLYEVKNHCIYVNRRYSASRWLLKIFTMFPVLNWTNKNMLLCIANGFHYTALYIIES